MNPRLRIRVVVLAALVLLFLWQRNRRLNEVKAERAAAMSGARPEPSSQPGVAVALPRPSRPASAPVTSASPQAVLAEQVAALQSNDYAAFKASFLVDVSEAQFRACKDRMDGIKIFPDWEMAKDTQQDGHRVLRVSIFGKSYTDFHFVNGKVLTAQVWCLPPS